MTPAVTDLWRHPIKAHGREALATVRLTPGASLPYDRIWAVAHANARLEGTGWSHCSNFTRGAKTPALMAMTATFDEMSETIVLSHPQLGDLTFRPNEEVGEFIEWISPIMPADRPKPMRIVRIEERGMTDTPYPSVSILNHASRRAFGQKAGRDLSMHRFRGNIWVDGLAPWEEFDWVGRSVRLGEAVLRIEEPTGRCLATAASPISGRLDTDTLGILEAGWGHTHFGVYGVVEEGGEVRPGDAVEVLR